MVDREKTPQLHPEIRRVLGALKEEIRKIGEKRREALLRADKIEIQAIDKELDELLSQLHDIRKQNQPQFPPKKS